jgi:hypothetical protein
MTLVAVAGTLLVLLQRGMLLQFLVFEHPDLG